MSFYHIFFLFALLFVVQTSTAFDEPTSNSINKDIFIESEQEVLEGIIELKNINVVFEDSSKYDDDSLIQYFVSMFYQYPNTGSIQSSDVKFLIETACILDMKLYSIEYKSVDKFIDQSFSTPHNLEELFVYNGGIPVSTEQLSALKTFIKYKANSAIKKLFDTNNLAVHPNKLSVIDVQNILDRSVNDDVFDKQIRYVLKFPSLINE